MNMTSRNSASADSRAPSIKNGHTPKHNHQSPTRGNINMLNLLWLLLPPALLAVGLSIFTQSFFLSRTSFDHRSQCTVNSAGNLLQSALGLRDDHVEYLRKHGILSDGNDSSYGCWVPRRVDSMAILVVDALRFDFARDHLPLSIGSRLFPSHNSTISKQVGTSKLYQFVADPPTVTMQRLKGLTTGGLPTFADITGSFGGASIDEDSWVEQLKNVPWSRRLHHQHSLDGHTKPQIAFVGDDTWVDLFPTQFDDCHPFPSFNTRDLDTVDNGCLDHLPRLLDGLVGLKTKEQSHVNSTSKFELIVSHFLGVDHVGHTYGPNNPHMESKLHQMDVMLSNTLQLIDDAPIESCIVALVLGDHGMTEDGNHGGGTSEEVNAGLFVHFSPGCNNKDDDGEDGMNTDEIPGSARAFESIHQIDLVPTISFLMGLPIPYANIGGLVPDLLPTPRQSTKGTATTSPSQHTATALALNAAQVWNYLHTYSQTSRDLPMNRMKELKELLDSASLVYRNAIIQSEKHTKSLEEGEGDLFDSSAYRQASALFKMFLAESTDLGKQVWTQFNEGGMMFGIGVLVLAWIMAIPLWKKSVRHELLMLFSMSRGGDTKENYKEHESLSSSVTLVSFRRLEVIVAIVFMVFQCGVLTFGNSYIEHEREIVTFFLSVLCLLVFRRWYFASGSQAWQNSAYLPLVVVLCSRINDVFATGHGLDPSIRLHAAHHPVVFLSSLLVLAFLRFRWLSASSNRTGTRQATSFSIDVIAVVCLAASWWEKRALDHSRNGFMAARIAMVAVLVGLVQSIYSFTWQWKLSLQVRLIQHKDSWMEKAQIALFRAMMFLVIVTGPSTALTAVLMVIQCASMVLVMQSTGTREVAAPVMAAIWRLAIRHVFFATNHHCSFNRLQYSAAFVATNTFQFAIAGSSLFMNTFGWEILGSILVLVSTRMGCARDSSGSHVWDWFRYFQWIEMLASCMSVSVMKRHLMVWAIFAPRFMFAAVFTAVGLLLWVADVFLQEVSVYD